MTDEEVKELLDRLEKVSPEQVRRVDQEFDRFITSMGNTLNAYAEQHRPELAILGKTLMLVVTDDIVKKRQGEPIGALSIIGDSDNAAALYRALGEELIRKGVLNDEEG